MGELLIHPTPEWLPSADMLPASLAPVLAKRDEAYERFNEHCTEWETVLSANWERIAEQQDQSAARAAVAAGKNPMDGVSNVARAAAERPRAVAAMHSLGQEVRRIDAELLRELRAEIPGMVGSVEEALDGAEAEYLKSYAVAMQHRAAFTRFAYLRTFLHALANGRFAPDFNPYSALGAGASVRGAEEVDAVRLKIAAVINAA
ncbi:hypothetical protein [Streptomyces sp900116325]|uniref:hypothetical protein n=1 Tax=Streptomyces sp. 900116325 TaxID=3154295 RepID=UPI0033259C50